MGVHVGDAVLILPGETRSTVARRMQSTLLTLDIAEVLPGNLGPERLIVDRSFSVERRLPWLVAFRIQGQGPKLEIAMLGISAVGADPVRNGVAENSGGT